MCGTVVRGGGQDRPAAADRAESDTPAHRETPGGAGAGADGAPLGDLAGDKRGEHGIEHVVTAHAFLPVRAPVEPRQEGVELVDQPGPNLAGGVALIAAVRQPPARRAAAGYNSQRCPGRRTMGRVTTRETTVARGDVTIAVTDLGDAGERPPAVLLHGLGGSSREFLSTAEALAGSHRVLLIDQRGHGHSTRRPADLSRRAFVEDVVAVIERLSPGRRVALVGQSMGAHTAFLTAAARPDLVDRLVMLEGHAGGGPAGAAAEVGGFFASWPLPFPDAGAAHAFLGESPLARAWGDDLEPCPGGLRPRFDADVMRRTIEAVHEPRWTEWESLTVPTLAVFAEHGKFSEEERAELIRRHPGTRRVDLPGASHDAHLDAFDAWTAVLAGYLESPDCAD